MRGGWGSHGAPGTLPLGGRSAEGANRRLDVRPAPAGVGSAAPGAAVNRQKYCSRQRQPPVGGVMRTRWIQFLAVGAFEEPPDVRDAGMLRRHGLLLRLAIFSAVDPSLLRAL